ncbi:MAG: hypothetical protein BYD32DRAFT_482973 [Podila humilis]|nr:MAG: hypothetical protein BYD32DRAFT_482973 [Podila humilis]
MNKHDFEVDWFSLPLFRYGDLQKFLADPQQFLGKAADPQQFPGMAADNAQRPQQSWNSQEDRDLILREVHNQWDYATSKLFIVLPSDLKSWDNSEPWTHKFRLYFICDARNQRELRKLSPLHVHLSNHPGYNITKPRSFFQAYGDYVLRVLGMVKRGYSSEHYEIPPLHSFKILWNCDTDITGSHLSKQNIGPLIDKAIQYLDELKFSKSPMAFELTRASSAAIATFLDVQDGHNSQGSLHCYIDPQQKMTWMCRAHSQQRYLNKESLEELKEFVDLHGGHVDMQQAILKVELGSTTEANQFLTLLTAVKHSFNISIKLMWRAKQQHIQELFQKISWTGTVILEIDGVTPGIQPLGPIQNRAKVSRNKSADIRLVILLNYPRPHEQSLFMEGCEVRLCSPPARSAYDWVEVQHAVVKFGETVDNGDATTNECKFATQEVQSALASHGLSEVAEITVYSNGWDGVFRLDVGSFVEMNTINLDFPMALVASGSLQKMTAHLLDAEADKKLYDMAQEHELKELNISTEGRNVLDQIKHLSHLWCNTSVSRRHALLERTESSRGHVVAQFVIGGRNSISTGGGLQKVAQEQELEALNISTEGRDVLIQLEHLIHLLCKLRTSHGHSQLERTEEFLRYAVAQFFVGRRNSSSAGGGLQKMATQLLAVETDNMLHDMAQEQELKALNIPTKGRDVLIQLEHLIHLLCKVPTSHGHSQLERTEEFLRYAVAQFFIGGRNSGSTGGGLQKMATQLLAVETDNMLHDMAQEQELEALSISTEGHDVLIQLEHLIHLLCKLRISHGHVQLERTEEFLRYAVAQFFIGRRNSSSTGGGLQKMATQLLAVETDNMLRDTQEQEPKALDILTKGRNVLIQLEHLIHLLCKVPTSHGHSQLERTEASLRYAIAEFLNGGRNCSSTGRSFLEDYGADVQSSSYIGSAHLSHVGVNFLQWDCDHVMSPLSDFFASVLAMATLQHPSVLTMFTLRASSLSLSGLESVHEVLNQSSLESLNVVCTPFHPDLSDFITQVLDSIQWSTLKLLVLSGPKIDQWIQLWHPTIDSRLLCLHIQGTGTEIQELSHSSALFVHQLAYSSPLLELHFENIQLEGTHDWGLITDGLDPSVTITHCI